MRLSLVPAIALSAFAASAFAQNGNDRYNGNYIGQGGNGGRQTVTCSSDNGKRNYCGSFPSARVRLQRQISGSACTEGDTWGVDDRGLWVDRGCRASFTVSGGGNNNGGYNNGNNNGGYNNDNRNNNGGYNNPNNGGYNNGNNNGGYNNGNRNGGYNNGGNFGLGGSRGVDNYPRVRVDTAGRGSYQGSGGGQGSGQARVNRGWVDTASNPPTVSLTGENNFRVIFYGTITQSDGRSGILNITNSGNGRAQGRAEFRLNNDRNEVESITVNGTGQGGNFSGNFSR